MTDSFESPWNEDAKIGIGLICSSNTSREKQQNAFTKKAWIHDIDAIGTFWVKFNWVELIKGPRRILKIYPLTDVHVVLNLWFLDIHKDFQIDLRSTFLDIFWSKRYYCLKDKNLNYKNNANLNTFFSDIFRGIRISFF